MKRLGRLLSASVAGVVLLGLSSSSRVRADHDRRTDEDKIRQAAAFTAAVESSAPIPVSDLLCLAKGDPAEQGCPRSLAERLVYIGGLEQHFAAPEVRKFLEERGAYAGSLEAAVAALTFLKGQHGFATEEFEQAAEVVLTEHRLPHLPPSPFSVGGESGFVHTNPGWFKQALLIAYDGRVPERLLRHFHPDHVKSVLGEYYGLRSAGVESVEMARTCASGLVSPQSSPARRRACVARLAELGEDGARELARECSTLVGPIDPVVAHAVSDAIRSMRGDGVCRRLLENWRAGNPPLSQIAAEGLRWLDSGVVFPYKWFRVYCWPDYGDWGQETTPRSLGMAPEQW